MDGLNHYNVSGIVPDTGGSKINKIWNQHEGNGHISGLLQYHVVDEVTGVDMEYLAHLSHGKASW